MKFLSKKNNVIKTSSDIMAVFAYPPLAKNTSRDIKSYINEGYCFNPIVYRCVREITTAASSVDIYLTKADKEFKDEKMLRLMKRPNLKQSWADFIKECLSEFLLSGNCIILKTPDVGMPLELTVLPSSKVEIKTNQYNMPSAYVYTDGSVKKEFQVNQVTGQSAIIHFKDYNPNSKTWGLPAMSAAALSADVHNNGLIWNDSLLKSGGRMTGIITMEGEPSEDAITRLTKYFKENFLGARNAGKVPVLTDGAKFEPLDRSPVDMDYLQTTKEVAKYIASCFGVPLPLIDNDNSSFNNVEQAKERLWTDTVLPMLNSFLETLSNEFSIILTADIKFVYDADSIPALERVRKTKAERLNSLVSQGLITINEARQELGYDPIDGGDTLFLPSSNLPIGMIADEGGTDNSVVKALSRFGLSEQEIFEATGKAVKK